MESVTGELLIQAEKARSVIGISILEIEVEWEQERLAAEGLMIDLEYFHGIEQQLVLLRRLYDDLGEKCSDGALCAMAKIGSRLRSAYSLNPKSKGARDCLRKVFMILNNQEICALKKLREKLWIVNISCQARLSKAKASFDSFQECDDLVSRLIVIGAEDGRCDFKITFDGTVLALPVPDSYEALVMKVAMLSYILTDHIGTCSFLKLDDDARMASGPAFRSFLARLFPADGDYFGFPVEPGSHETYWHGWHVGKCSDKLNEEYGMCFPLPPVYASGGAGYVLRGNAISCIGYAYLAQHRFLESGFGWAEDAIIGLLLHLQGLPLYSLGKNTEQNIGFSSEETRRAMAVGKSWNIFQARLEAMGRAASAK